LNFIYVSIKHVISVLNGSSFKPITTHLINRLGGSLGLPIYDSNLQLWVGQSGQVIIATPTLILSSSLKSKRKRKRKRKRN